MLARILKFSKMSYSNILKMLIRLEMPKVVSAFVVHMQQNQARGYKTFSCSTEDEISTVRKTEMLENRLLAFKQSYAVFIMLTNVKMPTIVGILTFISMII